MSVVNDATRLALHNRAREVLGQEEGDTLMAHLPPVGWADVATKQDVERLEERLEERLDQCATKEDVARLEGRFERALRLQTVWMASLVIGQSALYMAVTAWLRGN